MHDLLARAVADDPPARASDGNVIRDGFRRRPSTSRASSHAMATKDDRRTRGAPPRGFSGIPSLKLRYTRVFGWYVEVTRAHVDKAPREWRRKQTIANGERFTCPELDTLRRQDGARRGAICAAREAGALHEPRSRSRPRRRAPPRSGAAAWRSGTWPARWRRSLHRADFVRPEIDLIAHARRRGRSPPGRRAPGGRRTVRPQRRRPRRFPRVGRCRGDGAALARDRAEHGGQVYVHAAGRPTS